MEWLFILKDKGTHNQGWWLKIQSVDELIEYIKITQPVRNEKIFDNYSHGKEWNEYHPSFKNNSHCTFISEAPVTDVVVRHGANNNMTFFEALSSFNRMVALQQLEAIQKHGAIYINRRGGYHSFYSKDEEHGFVRRKELIFPQFKKNEIRIKKYPYGNHFYAFIDDMQVRDGDTLKWNTYEEAYNQALSIVERV